MSQWLAYYAVNIIVCFVECSPYQYFKGVFFYRLNEESPTWGIILRSVISRELNGRMLTFSVKHITFLYRKKNLTPHYFSSVASCQSHQRNEENYGSLGVTPNMLQELNFLLLNIKDSRRRFPILGYFFEKEDAGLI